MEQERKIKILQDLIQIQSANDHEALVADYLANLFEAYGLSSTRLTYAPGRDSLIVDFPGQAPGKVFALSGHFDVVDAGDPADWTYPPYAGEIHDGKMYGRGSCDMKAGVAAAAIAMIELKEAGTPFKGTIRFLGVVGEEIGMLGSGQVTQAGYMDDVDGLLIAEPSTSKIVTAHKGSLQFKLVAKGKAAHSSIPENGINSLMAIAEFVMKAQAKLDHASASTHNDRLGKLSNAFTVIEGGVQINSIPALTTLLGNTRTIPEFDNNQVIQVFEEVIADIKQTYPGQLDLIVTQSMFPVESDDDNALVQSIRRVVSPDLETAAFAGCTDASNFTRVNHPVDLAIYGTAIDHLAHQVDEYIIVKDYLESIEQLKAITLDYLAN